MFQRFFINIPIAWNLYFYINSIQSIWITNFGWDLINLSYIIKIGKNKWLTEYEKGKVDGLVKTKCSIREIPRQINRSHNVVMNYVKKEIYGKKKSSGRPKLYSAREIRQLIREVNNKQVSSAQAKRSLGLPGTRQTAWHTLKRCPHLIRKKKLKKPKLTDRHKQARLVFARKFMSWTTDQWCNVIFSHEKRFRITIISMILMVIHIIGMICGRNNSILVPGNKVVEVCLYGQLWVSMEQLN